ncbi:hypothetical protein ACFOYW_04190 [Gryllotalpicola reticulitermitis]|uniref:Uncharacterized protein n=1 Tax=Gryllotalpicola reticulitermitis TaxID=1184153 RepID=A0ABV8Q5D6_9MICO
MSRVRIEPTSLELARTMTGLVNLFQPERRPIARRGLRIAGARHVVQAAVTLAAPELRVVGFLVDGLHAVSMLGVALTSKRLRRPAVTQAALAAAFAAAEFWTLQDEPVPVLARARRPRRRFRSGKATFRG